MKKQYYVYKLTDPVTGQFYFGSRGHIDPENDKYMGSYKTWEPEDKDRLVKEIVKSGFDSVKEVIKYESNLIRNHIKDELNENYYVPDGGFHFHGATHSEETKMKMSEDRKGENHPMYGKTHSDEAKRKISESNKGKTLSEETKRKVSKNNARYWKDKTHSDETKRKLSKIRIENELSKGENNPMYGKVHSSETKELMRKLRTGKVQSEETKQKISESNKGKGIKSVIQYTKNGKLVNEWESITEAALNLDIYKSSISRCCNGKLQSTGGFHWKFKN